MKLYSFSTPTFNVTKPLLTAEELSLDLTLVKLDPRAGEHKTPEHLARHPLGKVPALEHDGRVLFESMAITRYLMALGSHDLAGDDAAQTDQWSEYVILQPGRAVSVLFWEEVIRGRMNGLEPNADAMDSAIKQLDRELAPLDARLGDSPWLSGKTFGLADIVTASYLFALADLSYDLTRQPNLQSWYERTSARPAFVRLTQHYR